MCKRGMILCKWIGLFLLAGCLLVEGCRCIGGMGRQKRSRKRQKLHRDANRAMGILGEMAEDVVSMMKP